MELGLAGRMIMGLGMTVFYVTTVLLAVSAWRGRRLSGAWRAKPEPVPTMAAATGATAAAARCPFHGASRASGKNGAEPASPASPASPAASAAIGPAAHATRARGNVAGCGAPGPRRPIAVHTWRRDQLGVLSRLAREYGDITCFRIAGQNLCLVNDPDAIHDVLVTNHHNFLKGGTMPRPSRRETARLGGISQVSLVVGEGLLTSEGHFHLRQRRMMQPRFRTDHVASYAPAMTRRATLLAETLQAGPVDMLAAMTRLTIGIAGETLLGVDIDDDADEISLALTGLMSDYVAMASSRLGPLGAALPWSARRRVLRGRDRLDRVVYALIHERRASRDDRGDILSLLLSAQAADVNGVMLTDRQIHDEVMTLLLAGHETTANALGFCWHLLAANPEVQRRLHDELELQLAGRTPTAADAERLPFTRQVVTETLRLYPPAHRLARTATRDHRISGYQIAAGTTVVISPYLLHRDPRHFPDPDRFDPDRWGDGATAPEGAFLAFGTGPRGCIGESFAWLEAVLVLATIAQRWRVDPRSAAELTLQPLVTLRPKGGLPLMLRPRQ